MNAEEKPAMKNRKPMIKVLVFAFCLLVFVGILTVERNIILEREAAEKLAESKAQVTETQRTEASTVKAGSGNLNFEALSYDVSDLLDSDIVQDLPKNAVIELKLGEVYYSVSRDSVVSGRPSNPDLTISLPANYAGGINNLCETIRKANQNKDLGIEAHSSQTSLMWKYRGMLKYKGCLG
jgi:hypothetical protein